MIHFNNVSYKYPGTKEDDYALKNISLHIAKGECVALLGRTGAGKSTFCYTLNGIIPKSYGGTIEGQIIIDSLDAQDFPIHVLADKVGLMFQDPESQLVGMTVQEELFFGVGNYGVEREEINNRINWALNLLRLSGYENREPSNLSGGEKQRVALASILVMQPKILVLDEPTSEMDPLGRVEVYDIFRKLRNSLSQTIIFTSHDSEDIADFVDRVIILDKGKIICDDVPSAVFNNSDILLRAGIRQPQVVEFWVGFQKRKQIKSHDIPLSIEEAKSFFASYWHNTRIQIIEPSEGVERHESLENFDENSVSTPIISIQNLYHNYLSGNEAIKNINLNIFPGELIAIIGQNGSGKTTLAKHINGLLKPTKGKVIVKGYDTRKEFVSKLSKYVGYCFQNPDHQIFNNSVFDEVSFGPKNLGFDNEEINLIVKEALKMFDLEDKSQSYPFNLGKGERQKLALASVIAMQSEIIIIDEPTTGLDWITGKEIIRIITQLNKLGKTILVITHDMNLVAENIPRSIVLYQGSILLDGPTNKVLSEVELLEKTFLKPPQINLLCKELSEYGFPQDVMSVEQALNSIRI
ncbi:MAG TPA: energy-coupling factor transporter ATPase [Brevefilum sp.]|nr:energy-coupling factor transporter ATPase [Brevefilum sp.]HOR18812.1 energy-coupling factor transporter ATPase [Brevefilum sp.]HPL68712.1 energy-coupling factor transporter ATPase [Brevefilum sp.]